MKMYSTLKHVLQPLSRYSPLIAASCLALFCYPPAPSLAQNAVNGSNFGGINNSNFGGTNNSNFNFGSAPGPTGSPALQQQAASLQSRLAAAQSAARNCGAPSPGDGVRRFLRTPGTYAGNSSCAGIAELQSVRVEVANFLGSVKGVNGGSVNRAW